MLNFSQRVARNAAAALLAQMAIKVLSFAFSVLIIRRLGVDTYGQYAAVLAFGGLFVSLADLGLSPYSVREIARLRAGEGGMPYVAGLFGNVLSLRLLLALGAGTCVLIAGWLTERPAPMMVGLALGVVGLLMYGAQGAFESVLTGFERLDWPAGARVLQQALFVGLGAVVLRAGGGYHSLIGVNLLAIALLTYISWRGVRQVAVRPAGPTVRAWGSLLRVALPFGFIGLALGLSYKFDSVLLNIFYGDAATGTYNAAYTLVFAVVVLSNVLNVALYPSLARQSVHAPASLPAIYTRILGCLLMITLPIAIGGWLLAEPIVSFLYGDQYAGAAHVLGILIWVIPLMFLAEFLGYTIVIEGAERRVARAIAVSSALNIGLNLLLVPRYGIPAASIMTVVTEAVLLGQYVWLQRARMRSLGWQAALVRPLAAALVMGGVVLAARGLPLFITIALGAVVYGACLLAFGALGRAELDFLRALRHRPVQA
jgi:O-antigen/teichoic acid export membrane protein